jgi:membrane glycosyltransferase
MSAKPLLQPDWNSAQPKLAMPDQDFTKPFRDADAPINSKKGPSALQFLIILFPAVLSLTLGWLLIRGVAGNEMPSVLTLVVVAAVIIPFYWDAVVSMLSFAGLFWKPSPRHPVSQGLRVAVLVLLYDENAEPVLKRAVRLLGQLHSHERHRFSLHVLSDSRKPESVLRERSVFSVLQRYHPELQMNYRNRVQNVDYKSGNIRDWIRSAGHLHDAMLVLDADSSMDSASVLVMAETLANDAQCALVQSVPKVLEGQSLWQKMQSYASHVVGTNLGKGLAVFSGNASNYYGHNAMLRIKAFAASAGLPHLKGEAPFGGVIMSHDFVEAALLCRAGWTVRLMPEASESFEETPPTLMEFLARDRRWCHGNMQHILLLKTPGLHFMSRFHLLQGAMTYLNAPLWLLAMLLWMSVPHAIQGSELLIAMAMIAATLLLPRMLGWFQAAGSVSFGFAFKELVFSSLLAPSLIVQRTRMILSIVWGRSQSWTKPANATPTFFALLKFHAVETTIGAILTFAILQDAATMWLTPVTASLVFSPLLARIVSGTRWRTNYESLE